MTCIFVFSLVFDVFSLSRRACRFVRRFREIDLLTLLQKFVTCLGTPVPAMQRRVLVSELRYGPSGIDTAFFFKYFVC